MTDPEPSRTAAAPRRETKPTVAGRLAADLRESILSARLAPGERLNLDQMRAAEGVSVSAMREAVGRLVADGLIEAESQRGYRVAPISRANLAEITTLRAELEPMALRRSLTNGGLEWRTEVAAAHFRLSRTPRSAADPATLEAWEEAHDAFHAALIGRCGMPLLLRFHRQLMAMNDRYRRILLTEGAG